VTPGTGGSITIVSNVSRGDFTSTAASASFLARINSRRAADPPGMPSAVEESIVVGVPHSTAASLMTRRYSATGA
jgi:hypothetical protein